MDPNRKYVFQRCFFNGYVWFLASVCIKKSDLARFTQEVKPSAAGKSRCGRSLSYQAFDSSDEEVWQIGLKPWWSRRHHHHHHVWHAHTHTEHPTSNILCQFKFRQAIPFKRYGEDIITPSSSSITPGWRGLRTPDGFWGVRATIGVLRASWLSALKGSTRRWWILKGDKYVEMTRKFQITWWWRW